MAVKKSALRSRAGQTGGVCRDAIQTRNLLLMSAASYDTFEGTAKHPGALGLPNQEQCGANACHPLDQCLWALTGMTKTTVVSDGVSSSVSFLTLRDVNGATSVRISFDGG